MTTTELKGVLEMHRLWLADLSGVRANLRLANLSEADLSGANLRWADLNGSK